MQSSKKDQEFRSIFQHVKAAQLQRSPSELFAQHIVTIVHHIKGESCVIKPILAILFTSQKDLICSVYAHKTGHSALKIANHGTRLP